MSTAEILSHDLQAATSGSQDELLRTLIEKVDALSQQVGQLQERARAADELKEELVHVARDALAALQVELSAIEHEFNAEEIVHFLRKLLRSTPRFIRLLDYLEGLDSLMDELGPLGKDVMRDLVQRLSVWEERGYFELAQSLMRAVDSVAGHADGGGLDWLAERAPALLETARRLTEPELLAVANDVMDTVSDRSTTPPMGLWKVARATRDPEVRQGLGVLLALLRQLGRGAGPPHILVANESIASLPEGGRS